MLKAIVILVQAIIVIVGAIYAYFLVSAQLTCSMIPSVGTPCSGEKTVIWGVLLLSAHSCNAALDHNLRSGGSAKDSMSTALIGKFTVNCTTGPAA
jgi:hypothetical protein